MAESSRKCYALGMARQTLRSALVAEDGLTTTTAASALMYEAAGGSPLPRAYEVTASGGPLPFTVILIVEGIRGFPQCRGIRIEAAEGQPDVANVTLRLPIARILRQSAQQVAGHQTSVAVVDGAWQATAVAGSGGKAATRRQRIDVDRLTEAATAWRSVRGLPHALEQMGRRLHVERSHAHRLRAEALAAGLLNPDEVPTRTSRRTDREKP